MKRYITLLLIVSLIVSCSYKEDDAFDKKPAERTTETLEHYKKTLEDGSYWLLTYYPEVYRSLGKLPRAHHSIGGYNIFLKLKDGKVSASSEMMKDNSEYTTYFTYQITEGPTLSFDTYNDVIHHFRRTSGQFPNARGGDIEFGITKEEKEVFTLLGRTSNTTFTLTKFTGDRTEYLNKVRENANTLKGKGLNSIQVNGKTISLLLFPSYRQLVFSYDDQNIQQAFIVTDKGIKFYEPVNVNGTKIEELYINEAKTGLITPDNAISITFVSCPIEINGTAKSIWFNQGYVSNVFLTSFNTTNAWIQWGYSWYDLARNTELLVSTIKGNDDQSVVGFTKFVSYSSAYEGGSWTYYEADFVGVGDHPDQVRIILKDPSDNESLRTGEYRNQIQFFSQLVTILYRRIANSGPYTVEDEGIRYKLTSVANSENWFYLYKN
ncbi:DUF4302 domain-containing protein [Capnocytophaga sp. oral taxon 338]|jgi:hypothetical protein|uniref:DUF4302 domain-containing protein n=1 Tax=Capnocytophaga sp. oral taxon 338 TaxID=710239 RepID=UPI000202F16C|nr:DUF4302 domain-containing protein [Capnocytophaga sp. oral taxon 338]EGD33174.1 hypothetical protein HMPREF9071_2367 [Capnocytophaga sp. oral taxon 338 str. F0234]